MFNLYNIKYIQDRDTTECIKKLGEEEDNSKGGWIKKNRGGKPYQSLVAQSQLSRSI